MRSLLQRYDSACDPSPLQYLPLRGQGSRLGLNIARARLFPRRFAGGANRQQKFFPRHRPCVARHRSSALPLHGTGTTAVLEERISDATEGHNDRTRECVNGICFHSGHCRGARTGPVTRLQKGGPLSRASSCSADRLTGAISLRYPHVRRASIDKQADGARPGDTVSGGPEFDAFEHLDRRRILISVLMGA